MCPWHLLKRVVWQIMKIPTYRRGLSSNLDGILDDKFNFTDEVLPRISEVYDDDANLIGYVCPDVTTNNPDLPDIEIVFYIDLSFPSNQEEDLALRYIQLELLKELAERYQIILDKKGCINPPLDNDSSWLVKITSGVEDFVRETTFDKCRNLEFDVATQDCFVYQAKVTGQSLGWSKELDDVEVVIENVLTGDDAQALTAGTEYQVEFLGIPKFSTDGENDDGRNNLDDPSNINEESSTGFFQNKKNLTYIGGLLVAAFCLASIGIVFVLWRRRRQTKAAIEKNRRDAAADDDMDMGSSYKDQFMGVHNSRRGKASSNYLTNIPSSYANMYPDNDSDADSWAQTDGTIGSLELQLEPITAEI